MPDPIALRPVDRFRSLLLPHGRPALDGRGRPRALSASQVTAALAALAPDVRLTPRAWSLVEGVVRIWHDDPAGAQAVLVAADGAEAVLLGVVAARRSGQAAEARRLVARLGRPTWLAALVPVVAAEGLSGPLTDEGGFRPDAFLGRCQDPPSGERAALERLQAAELMLVLQRALGG